MLPILLFIAGPGVLNRGSMDPQGVRGEGLGRGSQIGKRATFKRKNAPRATLHEKKKPFAGRNL